jgi:hypothetical protein
MHLHDVMLNFLMNQILVCYCPSQIFEMSHIFKGPMSCVCVVILPLRAGDVLLLGKPFYYHQVELMCFCYGIYIIS